MPLSCYRCKTSLAELSLPLTRLDECPECQTQLHVCRMCVNYAPRVPKSCTEDDALEVRDKKSANFCDYFEPSENAYRPGEYEADLAARDALSALFGNSAPAQGKPVDTTPEADAEAESDADTPSAIDQAKALFKD
jgi:hypothetical protein